MDMPGRRLARSAPLALLLTAAATLLMLALGTSPARAHDELLAATPADGSTVPTPPDAVRLEFSGNVQELGTEVAVTGPGGAAATDGALQVSDSVVVAPLADGLPAGRYTVDWRATSADGHPLSGSFAFSVTGADPASPPAEPSEPSAVAGTGSGTTAAAPAASSSPAGWIAGGAAVVLLGAGVLVARQLRGRG